MNPTEFEEILEEYFGSTREILETSERLLLELEQEESPPPERLLELRRAFHTLKGNSSMMGFGVVADLAHLMEDLLRRAEAGELTVGREVVSQLLAALGLIAEVVAVGKVPEETPASWAEVIASLKDVGTDAGSAPAKKGSYLAPRSRFVRVSQGALDSLLELSGELHVLLSGLRERAMKRAAVSEEAAAEAEAAEKVVAMFQRLENEVLRARLVGVGTVLSRFRLLVRDLAAAQGKEVSFVLSGGETTVDKDLVDELSEPILHLVRNAVDHGIETPEEREKAGKPRVAKVTLAARQTSSQVEIAVVDDGRGIDRGRVLEKARAVGIPVEGLDANAVLALIFTPGFSTRDEVTLVSGRGIGLDVVKADVERLGGAIFIQTVPGRGTEFRLTFPLTLALGHCLLLVAGGETFAVPVGFVAETVRVGDGEKTSLETDSILPWRGEWVPSATMEETLGFWGGWPGRPDFAVILSGGGRRRALLVDRVLGHARLVVKPLDQALGKPFGVAAASLLGDGRVVMILDAREILDSPSPVKHSEMFEEEQ